MDVNKICVYAIAKNEIKNVDNFYNSTKEADRVIVLDTGSTDGTAERLKELGVETYENHYEHFRFDIARNDSLEYAYKTDCNIFVCIDLDEIYEEGWSDILRELWIDGQHQRGENLFIWKTPDNPNEKVTGYWHNRMHSRGWKWRYPVHEALVREDTNEPWYTPEQCCHLSEERFKARHNADAYKSRKFYMDLILERYRENPTEPHSNLYVAREYLLRNEPLPCIEFCDNILSNEEVVAKLSPIELCAIYDYYGESLYRLGRYDEAIDRLSRALQIDQMFREPYVHLARCFIERKQFYIARGILEEAMRRTNLRSHWLEHSSLYTWETANWLSVCLFYTNDYEGALKYGLIAQSQSPNEGCINRNIEIYKEWVLKDAKH